VLGFGNPVRSDDAVGIYVIEKLKSEIPDSPDIQLLDMGTSAFEVLFKLRGQHRIILVDAVINTGEPVGTIYRLPAEEINREPVEDPLVFLHGMKWNQALFYAKKILQDDFPREVDVYLIAVDNTRLEIELSEPARLAGNKVAALIAEELDKKRHVNLHSQHIIVHHTLAGRVLQHHVRALVYFDPGLSQISLVAPDRPEYAEKKGYRQCLVKERNRMGDRAFSVQDILLDNNLDETDRPLEFEEENGVLCIRL